MNVTPCTAERHSLRGAAAEALSPVFCPLALPRLACVEHLVSLMAHVAPLPRVVDAAVPIRPSGVVLCESHNVSSGSAAGASRGLDRSPVAAPVRCV